VQGSHKLLVEARHPRVSCHLLIEVLWIRIGLNANLDLVPDPAFYLNAVQIQEAKPIQI
jgi:hypothetical protein